MIIITITITNISAGKDPPTRVFDISTATKFLNFPKFLGRSPLRAVSSIINVSNDTILPTPSGREPEKKEKGKRRRREREVRREKERGERRERRGRRGRRGKEDEPKRGLPVRIREVRVGHSHASGMEPENLFHYLGREGGREGEGEERERRGRGEGEVIYQIFV